MKKDLLLTFLLTLVINSIYSQSSASFAPKINNIPTSPEAALLGRFGEIPVGYYTGTADISIPIYDLKEAGVDMPIILRYHSSGIKVEDEATWVGLGWDLSPGGEIIQEVRGKPDDLEHGVNKLSNQYRYSEFKNRFGTLYTSDFHFRYQTGIQHNNCCSASELPWDSPEYDSNEVLTKLLDNYGQPDIYHYNFAGNSGRFYINGETDEIVLLDKKEAIKFEKIGNTWTAKTMDGTLFRFGTIETANAGVYNEYTGVTFKLDFITFNNGKTISLNYTDESYSKQKHVENFILFTMENLSDPYGPMGELSVSQPLSLHNCKTLTSITTSDAIVNFNLEDRDDISVYGTNHVKRLKSIDILSNITNKKVKSFEFGYSYFPYNLVGMPSNYVVTSTTDALGKRLRLDFVKEIGYDQNEIANTSKPAYLFDYDNSVVMPLKTSKSVDFYGYYNGENNTSLLPDLDYFDLPYDSRYQNAGNIFSYNANYPKANRFANNDFGKAYMLKKVTYPTGGSTEFEYEPNSFTNQFIPTKQQNDLAHKHYSIEDKNLGGSSEITSAQFHLSKATTINFKNRIHNGYTPFNSSPSDTFTYDQMFGSKIQFLKINMTGGTPVVTVIKVWDLSTVLRANFENPNNNGVDWNEEIRVPFDSNPNVSYSVVVSLPPGLVNNSFGAASVKSQFNYYDDTGIDTSISKQGGFRIKSVKNYTTTGVIANHKSYNYSGGKILNKFEPLSAAKASNNFCSVVIAGPDIIYNSWTSFFNRIIISTDDFGLDGGNLLGYDRVEETDLKNGISSLGKKVFKYYNQVNQTKKGLPNIPYAMNGYIQSEEIYNNIGTKLNETTYVYSSPTQEIFFGFKIHNQSFGSTDYCNTGGQDINEIVSFVTYDPGLGLKYSISTYPLISVQYMLSLKTSTQYFNGNPVTSVEQSTYNLDGKLKTITSTSSKGETLMMKYFYATDYPPGMVYGALVTYNMTGIPLRIESLNGGNLVSANTTGYDAFNGLLLPKYVFFEKGASGAERRMTCDSYDIRGNLFQYTLENGVPVSVLWGHNKTKPIAKIENATNSQIMTALNVTDLNSINEGNIVSINNLRTNSAFQNSMITTYVYKPLVGVSIITDPKGNSVYYEYDSFGRLSTVKDANGNKLSENEYNYRP